MSMSVIYFVVIVRDYDEANNYYTNMFCFTLVEDTYLPDRDKRFVVESHSVFGAAADLLSKASEPHLEF